MYIPSRKLRVQRRTMALKGLRIVRLIVITLLVWILLTSFFGSFTITIQSPIVIQRVEEKLINPLQEEPTPTPTPHGAQIQVKTTVLAKEPEEEIREIKGTASYYSRAGCLGCSENMVMANGQELDDDALTLALTPETVSEYKLLNDKVTVINLENGQKTTARVTDTGGFSKYDRVADLSLATKNAINCPSLCQVKIVFE